MYDVHVVANYIIAKCNELQYEISNLRLQKLLYYVQGYFFKIHNESAFDSNICNWPYGPVVPEIYYEYCIYGANPILFEDDKLEDTINRIKNRNHRRLVDTIIKKCNDYTPGQLVDHTHNETPWKDTVRGSVISSEKIQDYFNCNNPLSIGI